MMETKHKWCLYVFILIFLFFITVCLKNINYNNRPYSERRKEMILKQFSAWDGSHYKITKYIKSKLNDPFSYEHIETKAYDKKDYINVKTTFCCSNMYGGKEKKVVWFKVDDEGNFL